MPGYDSPHPPRPDPSARMSRLLAHQAHNATGQQRASVLRWQNKDERFYHQVQQAIRGRAASPEALDVADDLRDLMAPLPESVVLWRGIRDIEQTLGITDVRRRSVRESFEVPAFFATSLDRAGAESEFTRPGRRPALYRIVAQPGAPVLWVPPLGNSEYSYQKELLFPPGIVLRILELDETNTIPIIAVEVRNGKMGR